MGTLKIVAEGAEASEGDPKDQANPTANEQRKEDRHQRLARRGLMGAGQADAFQDDLVDHRDHAAADRHHRKQVRGTCREAGHAKRGFEGAIRAADQHQAEMQDAAADKEAQNNQDRHKRGVNDERSPHTKSDEVEHMVSTAKPGNRLEKSLKKN